MIRLLLAPAKAGGRAYLKVVNVGLSMFTNVLTRIIGGQALKDLSLFVASLETMFGGFRERAEQTYQLLKAPGTQFLVVAAPERDALREAAYFVERLSEERMPLAGLVLNRVHATSALHLSADRSAAGAEELDEQGAHPIAAALLRLHADRVRTALRERRLRERFTSAHPHVPLVEVAAQADDVHDIDGLRRIAEELAAGRVDALPPEPPTPVKGKRQPTSGSSAKPRRSSARKVS
jgi:hypothetical protein